MKILSVVGARPNFMKVAPIHRAFKKYNKRVTHIICHTGQHYDTNMSEVFFNQLGLPAPDYYLGIGGGSHAEQTGKIMIKFEEVLLKEKPDLIIVVGDVNSTIACSLTAQKLHIQVAHVEAGLRSFDRYMPEEINRILTDTISDYLFVTEKSGLINLRNEGVEESKIFFVGNCMIDSLISILPLTKSSDILEKYDIKRKEFIIVTMHRPSNVDSEYRLSEMAKFLNSISSEQKVIFPIHPRTRKNLENFGLDKKLEGNVILTDPVGYIDFIAMLNESTLILTDSGGIQEESTYLGVQCITLRTTTERPSSIEEGTNQLVGEDFNKAEKAVKQIINGYEKIGTIPELWDGRSAERISEILFNNSMH
ncbi:MAG: UDP-N-acetylglucosamine 2-epimerase (non-hydrolyzing) [Ignavibacterium sp.]|nr:MAG: UDP-N-acetylglucosamine 2-epimerase (non-hydrolyzing) [Ignavibacterium sp.]